MLQDEEPNWLNVEWPEIEFDQDNSIQQRVGNEIIESEPNVEISLGGEMSPRTEPTSMESKMWKLMNPPTP